MPATADLAKRNASASHPLALGLPLVHFQLAQWLALTQWSTTMWLFGQGQLSRCSTFLAGGVPLDA